MKSVHALLLLLSGVAICADFRLQVESGDKAYTNAIVTVGVSDAALPEHGLLTGAEGSIPFQRSGQEQVTFILPHMKSHSVQNYSFRTGSTATAPALAKAELNSGRVTLSVSQKNVLVYQGEESALPRSDIKPQFKRGGYI